MTNTIDDNPLTRMALGVVAMNASWFALWAWTMDAYKLGIHSWGYPLFKDGSNA